VNSNPNKVNNMRKLASIAIIALAGVLALSGCSNKGKDEQAANQAQSQATKLTRPTDKSDTQAWNAYLVQILKSHLQGMTADQPYAYLIPAGDTDADKAARQRQLSSVTDTVARGVLPGNLLAFAGPDSSMTADVIVKAFDGAKPNSFKGVIVLFIGDQADQQRVADALKPTGATFRFVQM
jgi:outer membrane murein-binding lipoprotein Lpp